ncbi:MAG: nuclear transport factor 2 family protein [Acidobacteriia bacterium]|nr:nuclear transport factor 2 family protein [Terriglobia bacterium]
MKFLEKINQHDVDGLVSLMSEQHVLVDSLGNRLQGREKLKAGWQAYFEMCPDYTVSHEEIFAQGQRGGGLRLGGRNDCCERRIEAGEPLANSRCLDGNRTNRPARGVAGLCRQ